MIKIQGKFDRSVKLACSGGVDSMAIADFLSNSHEVTLLFFDHGTETSRKAKIFLEEYASKNPKVYLEFGFLDREKTKSESWEEFWRVERYKWFHSFDDDIITCHHLDDCVETWVWSSMHGCGKIIPYRNKNVIRPFRLTRKSEFVNWCKTKNVSWIEDESNTDIKYMRNFIRREMMPNILTVNPGIHKVIAKKVLLEME